MNCNSSQLKVLSINGGGVWGAAMVEQLSKAYDNLDDIKWSYYSGTSVGAIIAGLLAIGYRWDRIAVILMSNLKDIFDERFFWQLRGYKYDDKALNALLDSFFGDIRMNDVGVNLIIPAWRCTGPNRLKVFTNQDNVFIKDAVRASIAAPTYFKPWTINGDQYMDGGLIFNNPSLVALAHVLRYRANDDIFMLNLSTGGQMAGNKVSEKASLVDTARYLVRTMLSGGADGTEYIMERILGSQYWNIEPTLTHDFPLDDVDNIKAMSAIWKDCAQEHTELGALR